ncbi:MAG TPA: Ppx/GppA phosphatase family protein [Polyangiaceae bacterium]|jgi:exopolyphosphatase/guanosine-5'-triphosphate,3'-diphosphate pyrophosphatase
MARFAAIDVGSNALRLRIIEASTPDRESQLALLPGDASLWHDVTSLRAPVRLGTEVFLTGKLAPATIGQACASLRDFRQAMDDAKVVAYRATATSAVREASNGGTLVERARREAGVELEVIEGIEEARLIQLAVLRRLGIADKRALLVDVGGGSTELTVVEGGESGFSISLPLGTVRVIETFLKGSGSVDRGRAKLMAEQIDRSLAEARPHLQRSPLQVLVGTGGNIETLADLCPLKGGTAGAARAIDVAAARTLFTKLCSMTAAERRDAYSLRPDRADTIVPATAIFLRIAEILKVQAIAAPGVGLKEGILEELVDKYFNVWDAAGEAQTVLAACARLGRRYQFDEAHGKLVAGLAAQLFDDLHEVHAMGDRDRLLLRAAAMLHDVGDFVRYDGHHKHSYYLILHSDIMGLTPEERAIVANVARYHRKSTPDPSHPNFRDLDKDARGRVRGLAAILRIADALDREHLGKVDGVQATVDTGKRRIVLHVLGREDRELEEWTVQAKADLLRDVFGLDALFAADSRAVDPAGDGRSVRPPPRSAG